MIIRQFLSTVFLSFLALCSAAEAKQSAYSATEVEIFSNFDTENPAALVKVTPKDGWHIYWQNPGDTGMPTEVKLSSGSHHGILKKQSVPKHFYLHQLITQYAYDEAAYWLFDISVPAADEPLTLSADVSWLACLDECVAENVTVTLTLPEEKERQSSPQWEKELFNAAKTFAQPLPAGTFSQTGDKLSADIFGFSAPVNDLKFIPYIRDLLINNHPADFSVQDNVLHIETAVRQDVNLPAVLKTVLLTDAGNWELDLLKTAATTDYSLLSILLMAFVGGLLLNLMPCIFPILFLKAFHLLNSAYSRKKISAEALLYFAGVIVSFLSAAGLLWFLRRGGEAVGWGFQLQSPVFVAFLFVLFFMTGLLFLGVLNFNAPVFNRLGKLSVKNNYINAFLTGLFSVLIASPCSAPFMGAAVGYSITQPLYIYFPVFLALAIGYALPFTLIGLFPQRLAKHLPRPGKWMDTLKKIFAVPVFLTCLWLGWIFYNQVFHQNNETISQAWETFSEQKTDTLRQNKQPFLIDFTAKWCLTCLINEKTALSSETFEKIVAEKHITLLKADWTNKSEEITHALAKYGRNSVPLYVYYDANGEFVILPQLLTPTILEKYLH